ncbi:MAG: hypothetical protein GEU93_16400 [Propionibacteriales bacterium]|nr:hypothetical protein [Propionibacteriales bacterium]
MYDVVLLIEQQLSKADARQVVGLHDSLEETVHYHMILPCEDAATRIETALGSIAASEVLATSAMAYSEMDLDQLQQEIQSEAQQSLNASMSFIDETGHEVTGEVTCEDPISALAAAVEAHNGQEAIILTRPHIVAEFFHLDWTSKARRKIGVPCLHLLEHENFDEQSGGGEGVYGM